MATYRSQCPHCGDEIVRHYGEMGEGLLAEEPCQCDMGLRWWEVVVFIALLGLLFYSCSARPKIDNPQPVDKPPVETQPLYRGG